MWANPLMIFHCADGCCDLALLYARMGLHRYNLLHLPELPRENPFVEDGTNRFRLLKDSELEDNDWIRLYLDLAVATTNRSLALRKESLTNLKILKVATESSQGLGDYDAVFYIEYEDSCEPRVGKDVHRVAIVRRFLDKQSQVLRLRGHNQSINKIAAMEAGSSSALD